MSFVQFSQPTPAFHAFAPYPLAHHTPEYPLPAQDCQTDIKSVLRRRLANGTLGNMPAGFPFHYSMSGRGSGKISYDSFDFYEHLSPSGSRQPYSNGQAVISFRAPGNGYQQSRYLTWSVNIPTQMTSFSRADQSLTPVAHVHVDPALMNMPYGRFLKKNPCVVLRALSISLELGLPITITLVDNSMIPLLRHETLDDWHPGDVVYIGTRSDGAKQVLHIAGNN